jgi:hypothetical protein
VWLSDRTQFCAFPWVKAFGLTQGMTNDQIQMPNEFQISKF